ncbi:unnamed protein product [Thelazia callipaeda]|uniref:C3H1-type domain-containing protein n=1 Tax=Thelazia callipaeda TaxID=103827 RepID=A0A0N5D9Q9_THECL|nr:unnamed protein product [Thelazia callipaeda]
MAALSLLEARLRAFAPDVGVPAGACRLQLLDGAFFLSDIKIAEIVKESDKNNSTLPYSNTQASNLTSLEVANSSTVASGIPAAALSPMATLEQIASMPAASYQMLPEVNFMQALTFPFGINITSNTNTRPASTFDFSNVADANVTRTAHSTATPPNNPSLPSYNAMQINSTSEQFFQPHQLLEQYPLGQHIAISANRTISAYHSDNQVNETGEDLKSQREAKIELFSEDENDYGDEEENMYNFQEEDITAITVDKIALELAYRENFDGNGNPNAGTDNEEHNEAENYEGDECLNNYSSVVSTTAPETVPCHAKKYSDSESAQQNTTSVPTQMSRWDQLVVERGRKFNKPAPQCIHWNNPKHRLDFPCRFWHPREHCRYYPHCSNTADECGFAHPFCGHFCRCPVNKRDPQKNHRVPEEKYLSN